LRFSLSSFLFSLFSFLFLRFAFRFSLFSFHSSLFAAAASKHRPGTGVGFLPFNVTVTAALQLKRIALAPALACPLVDDVISSIMTSQLSASLLGDVIFTGAPAESRVA
jgi:hypothetical protein